MSYEIAAIGDQETTVGFALAGATLVHVHRARDETLAKLGEFLTGERVGLVLITHRVAEELGDDFRRALRAKGVLPMVLRIPDKTGYVPRVDELGEIIRRTVGAEVVLRRES